jgi:hypothetical protein
MAFPGTYNFNYYRGDTAEFVVRPKASNGSSFDLSGYNSATGAKFTIANRRGSTGSQFTGLAVIDTVNDLITCTILPTLGRTLSSGTYVYDVQISSGANVIFTLLTGTITVTDDVTGAV